MALNGNDDDWPEYRRLVLHKLGRLNMMADDMQKCCASLKRDMVRLETQMRMGSFLISVITSTVITAVVVAIMSLVLK